MPSLLPPPLRAFLPALFLLAAGSALAQDTVPPPEPDAGSRAGTDATGDAELVEALGRRAEAVARRASASIVSVTATTAGRAPSQTVFPGLVVAPPAREAEQLEATGFVVEPGVVATSFHVSRLGARYEVRFAGGVPRPAALLGSDEVYGIALLRVDPPEGAAPLDDAAPPLDAGRRTAAWLATAGGDGAAEPQVAIVRAATCPDSSYDRYLSASICLQPGAAGAPLLGHDGRLVGMAVGSAAQHASPPSQTRHCRSTLFVRGEDVLAAAREIARTGRVRHARIGILLDADTNRVDQLLPGGPAELAGLREGDAIVSVAGVRVASAVDITRALLRRRPGDSVPLEAMRSGAIVPTRVTLDEVSMPPVPARAPVPGVTLRWTWSEATESGPVVHVVTVRDVAPASGAEVSGLRVGDEVRVIDGHEVIRFLTRHRVLPAAAPPAEIVVRRDGAELRIALREP